MTNKEIEQVKEVINNYATGTYTADMELLRSAFHKDAHMTGYLGDELLIGTIEPFFEDIASAPSMKDNGDNYNYEITNVVVTGKIASVVLEETGFRGAADLEDHFQLIYDQDKWSIISKNFTTL